MSGKMNWKRLEQARQLAHSSSEPRYATVDPFRNRRCAGVTKEGLKCQARSNATGYCPGHRSQVPPEEAAS